MLIDLYLLQSYFAEPFSAVYEEDLIERYGAAPVRAAIASGILEHRRIPCASGRQRCICGLSEKGRAQAQQALAGS